MKCKLKPQWSNTTHLLESKEEWLCQVLGRIWGDWNTYTLLVGMQGGIATLENGFVVSKKVKHILTLWPSHSTLKYLPKRNEKHMSTQRLIRKCSQQHYFYGPKWKTIQIAFIWWMNKQNFHMLKQYWAIKIKRSIINATVLINLKSIMICKRS